MQPEVDRLQHFPWWLGNNWILFWEGATLLVAGVTTERFTAQNAAAMAIPLTRDSSTHRWDQAAPVKARWRIPANLAMRGIQGGGWSVATAEKDLRAPVLREIL